MDIFNVWILAMTNVGALVLGFLLGVPFGRKMVFREAKSNRLFGDLK